MKFKNKKSGEIVEANTYAKVFAFSHNSNYVKYDNSAKENNNTNSKNKKSESKKDEVLDDGIVIE